jgi:hypothetical protein
MRESVTGGFQVLVLMYWLLPSVNSLANKGWARPVAAAAVIPAPQVVIAIIGPKASVAGLAGLW